MRPALAALLIAACGGSGTDDRIDQLERRVAALTNEATQTRTNESAITKTMIKGDSDVAERLLRAGIIDEKNQNVTRWWCNGLFCWRTEIECSANIDFLRAKKYQTRDACIPSRIAYCRGDGGMDGCLEMLQSCLKIARGEGIAASMLRVCIGVE